MHIKRASWIGSAVAAATLSVAGVAVAANILATPDTGSSPGDAKVPAGYTGINDPNLQNCMDTQQVCNRCDQRTEVSAVGKPTSRGCVGNDAR